MAAVLLPPDEHLAETLRSVITTCGTLRVTLASEPTPGQGWLRASGLTAGAERLIAAEAARIEAGHGRAPRTDVAASRLLHHYLWSAGLLFSGPWYLTGQLPAIRPEDVWIEVATGDLMVRPTGSAPGGEAELRAAVAAHFAPVLDAFKPFVKRGPRALWGMATDDLVSGIWYLGKMRGEEEYAVRVAEAVLPGDTAPFPGAADFRRLAGTGGRSHLTRTRLGCCLYYAVEPPDACVTCPRTCDADRVRRLEA
ncbi:(2Fe-2S)-binding protein [Kitasatospora sp. NPDC002040]|uniref:(2Fe-2S)-binding protein n=1 Tax=Kitasatospora sp. NPDC002040 TaxID=3154661 RepID=UPI00331C7E30